MQEDKRMKKGKLICFAGIDGSGKSTLAKALNNLLAEEGINSKYIWCGWRQFQSFALRPFAKVVKVLSWRRNTSYSANNPPKLSKTRLSSLLINLILIDYLLYVWTKIAIPLIRGNNIICDRYIHDTIAGIVFDFNYTKEKANRLLTVWSHLLPKPNTVFFVDTPAKLAYQRKMKTSTTTFHHLAGKREIYMAMSQEQAMVVLDGSQNLKDIKGLMHQKIVDYVERGK